MSRIKELERQSKSYENRWRTAKSGANAGETYVAVQDYKSNIEEQEKQLKLLDPNSREYDRAEQSVQEQRSKLWEMEYDQRRSLSDRDKQNGIHGLEAKNDALSREMGSAVTNGDVKRYEQLRTQYEKNLAAQDKMSSELRESGIECRDTVQQQRNELYGHDVDMRNTLNENISERESKGKAVSEEDRANAQRYVNQVKKDEIENVKWIGDRRIQNMQLRGESAEKIKAQQQENQESVKYVERINR